MHFVAVHAGHIETQPFTRCIEHGVVAGALCAKAKIVAHLHIAHAQALHQHLLDEVFGRLAGQLGVERQHHHLVNPAALQFLQLVAQCGDARWGKGGFVQRFGKVVSRVRLKGEHATGHATVSGFAAQQRQHGLVPAVHTVKVADGQGAGGGQVGVMEAAKNLHVARGCCPRGGPSASLHGVVKVRGYIVTEPDPAIRGLW